MATDHSKAVRVFLVESPFQLISATEAAAAIRPEERAILVVMRQYKRRERNDAHIRRMVGLFRWNSVYYLDLIRLSLIGRHRRISCLVRQLRTQIGTAKTSVFIGEYRLYLMHLISNALRARESWILDDGTAILQLHNDFELGWKAANLSGKMLPINWAIQNFFYPGRCTAVHGRKRFLFTAFHQFFDDPRVISNDFQFIGNAKVLNDGVGRHAIIGQKLSECGVCSLDTEILAISAIVADAENEGLGHLVYVPHRDDSDVKLAALANIEGLDIMALDTSVEFAVLEGALKLASVSGFYSTALFTLPQLFKGISVTSYKLPDAVIDIRYRSAVSLIYNALGQTGAAMIALPEEKARHSTVSD